jgi:hypothetical protein
LDHLHELSGRGREIDLCDLVCRGAVVACALARGRVKLLSKVIQHQHTAAIDLVETKLIDGMDSLPLAILLDFIDFGILVNLKDLFLYIEVAVVWRVR